MTRVGTPKLHVPRVYEDTSWMDSGLCRGADQRDFFPALGDLGGMTGAAKALCARCPVADTCLDYALRHSERFGIWGGKTPKERAKIRKELREA